MDETREPLTDEEIRALGFEPTPHGWRWIGPEKPETDRAELIEGLREALRKKQYG